MARPTSPASSAASPAAPRWLLPAVLALAALAFANTLDGAFVYDDTRQIAANALIQDTSRIGEALASDVWAFRADDGQAGSNYWRPTFVAWLILCHALFGLAPLGWHVMSVALHVAVTALAFVFVRRLGLGAWAAAAVALVFAVHPVHAESVAWISGSPDLLLGVAMLGAAILAADHARAGGAWRVAAIVALGTVAMGAKEIGIMTPLIVGLTVWAVRASDAATRPTAVRSGVRAAAPLVAVGVVYLVARHAVIGGFSQDAPWEHGLLESALTASAIVMFYLGQILWPATVGPSYPLRPVSADTLTAASFGLPLVGTLLALALAAWLARQSRAAAVGVALFALLLLPAFNIGAFPPEHIVHDRYLYLPLLGALLAVVAVAEARWDGRRVALVAAVVAVPLLLVTLRVNRIWTSEEALWAANVETDPTSAFAWTQHGIMLQRAGQTDAAVRAYDRAIAIRPMAAAISARAELMAASGRGADAEAALRAVIAQQPTDHGAYERLAVILQQQNRLDEAEAVLRAGRAANPGLACAFSVNLGVVLYLQGRPDEAAQMFDEAVANADREVSAACRAGLFHRAQLALEQGRDDAARADFERFLALTSTLTDAATQQRRGIAQQRLAGG